MSTITDRIVSLRLGGTPPQLIATITGVPRDTVYAALRHARVTGTHIPRFTTGPMLRVTIPAAVLAQIEPDAAQRGLSPVALARKLLWTIAREHMVDAVLDDGVSDA